MMELKHSLNYGGNKKRTDNSQFFFYLCISQVTLLFVLNFDSMFYLTKHFPRDSMK